MLKKLNKIKNLSKIIKEYFFILAHRSLVILSSNHIELDLEMKIYNIILGKLKLLVNLSISIFKSLITFVKIEIFF